MQQAGCFTPASLASRAGHSRWVTMVMRDRPLAEWRLPCVSLGMRGGHSEGGRAEDPLSPRQVAMDGATWRSAVRMPCAPPGRRSEVFQRFASGFAGLDLRPGVVSSEVSVPCCDAASGPARLPLTIGPVGVASVLVPAARGASAAAQASGTPAQAGPTDASATALAAPQEQDSGRAVCAMRSRRNVRIASLGVHHENASPCRTQSLLRPGLIRSVDRAAVASLSIGARSEYLGGGGRRVAYKVASSRRHRKPLHIGRQGLGQ